MCQACGSSCSSTRLNTSSAIQVATDPPGALDCIMPDEPGECWIPVRENRRREPGGFWWKSWCLTTVFLLLTRAARSDERARFVGFFKDAQGSGRLDAGSRAGFTSSRPPPPWTSVVNFPHFCTMGGLEKLGFVDQNWSERKFSVFLLTTLVVWVGDNIISSRSRLLSIWSKEVWWTVLTSVGAIACRVA